MKNELLSLTVLSTALLVGCCSFSTSNKKETRNIEVKDFSAVDVGNGINLNINFGDAEKMVVEAKVDYIDDFVAEVKGEKLLLYLKNNRSVKRRVFNVTLTAIQIDCIDAHSGSEVRSECIESDNVRLIATSGASINAEIRARKAKLKATSGASIDVGGDAQAVDIQSNTGAGLNARGLNVRIADVDLSSGASAQICVKDSLQVKANTGSSLNYYGNPSYRIVNKSSGASVSKL